MKKVITIFQNETTKDKDLLSVTIQDLVTGKNKIYFDCHLSSIVDIISCNIISVKS